MTARWSQHGVLSREMREALCVSLFFSAILVTQDCSANPVAPIRASRSHDFVQSIGVNTHLGYIGTSYSNLQTVESELAYIRVDHIRDSAPVAYMLSIYQALASLGVKFDLVISGYRSDLDLAANLPLIDALAKSRPCSVFSVEGPNELNDPDNKITFHGHAASNPAVDTEIMQALHTAVRADLALAGAQVINASLTNGIAGWQQYLDALGNMSAYVDQANWHVYFNDGIQPAAVLQVMIDYAKRSAPGRQVTITETGYGSNPAVAWGLGVDQTTQAKLTLNDLVDAYEDNVSQTYIYELMDEVSNPPSSDTFGSNGLFLADGQPKLVATSIHNLTSILADTARTARTFSTGTLEYSITNLPTGAKSLLLEKSDGVYDLVIWAEPQIWNRVTRTGISVPGTTITVTFVAPQQSVETFDPLVSTNAIAAAQNPVESVSFALTDHPVILQIK